MPQLPARLLLTALLALPSSSAAGATFEGLGSLRRGGISRGLGISGDGRVAVGSVSSPVFLVEGFRWTTKEGMVGLGVLEGGTRNSRAEGASHEGDVIGGDGGSANGTEGFVWTPDVGLIGVGDLPGALFASSIFAVSGDGSTAVGTGHSSISRPQSEAIRWTLATGIESLGDLPGGVYGGRADGVNGDGSVIVGRSESPSGPEAFRWEDDGVCDLDGSDPMIDDCMVGLGDLPAGIFASRALDVTPDGSLIVGKGESERGTEAFVWTAETGMFGLGDLPGGKYLSEALAVSADGNVVVGRSEGPEGDEAFVWNEADGIRNLKELLEQDFGLDLEGWVLVRANGISDDGQVIVGSGRNPSGTNEAWIVELPEPSAALARLLAGVALVALAYRRVGRRALPAGEPRPSEPA